MTSRAPINPPPGCHFHTRCPFAQEVCRREVPVLADDGTGHATACPYWPEFRCRASPRRIARARPRPNPASNACRRRSYLLEGRLHEKDVRPDGPFPGVLRRAAAALAETHLRIGLAEDPDVLDPSLARTYVGRIVFASICDKLFDIDEKLTVVPQLALSHETSSDGKTVTIKLRPGVKFHDGEPLDAEAAKYSLDRHLTMKGSFRKPELGSVDKVEVVDPLTIRLS